ncbi:hypothetical protein ACVWYH_003091 [Bradyrhizobium sp. GM24.11]
MTVRRIRPIFASDVRRLGGTVSISAGRDRVEGKSLYRVAHVSRGGDCQFLSLPLESEDHAQAAAQVLAEFVGGEVRR